MVRTLLVAVVALAAPSLGAARTWHILPDGTGDVPTIQAGVDSSAAGDTLSIGCGEYVEPRLEIAHPITLLGESPGCVVVRAVPDTFSVSSAADVLFRNLVLWGETTDLPLVRCETATRLTFDACQFLVENAGESSQPVAGVANCTDVRFTACRFVGGVLWHAGALDCVNVTGLDVSDCTFQDGAFGRGGVSLGGCSQVAVTRCEFTNNTGNQGPNYAAALTIANSSTVTVAECSFLSNVNYVGSFSTYQSTDVEFRDCTVSGSWGSRHGAIAFLGSSVELTRCDISDNGRVLTPIRSVGSDLALSECRFADNRSGTPGGVLWVEGGQARIAQCEFLRNRGYELGGAIYAQAPVSIDGTLFAANYLNSLHKKGGAIFVVGDGHSISRCTFVGNDTAGQRGSAVYVQDSTVPVPIEDSIFADNRGTEVIACFDATTPALACVDQYGNVTATGDDADWTGCTADQAAADGNFSADPLFCDASAGDFAIRSDSPCAPPGMTGCGLVGALPVGCGPVTVEAMSWGRIKGAYR